MQNVKNKINLLPILYLLVIVSWYCMGVDHILMHSLHSLLNFEIGGLDSSVIICTTDDISHVHCIHNVSFLFCSFGSIFVYTTLVSKRKKEQVNITCEHSFSYSTPCTMFQCICLVCLFENWTLSHRWLLASKKTEIVNDHGWKNVKMSSVNDNTMYSYKNISS